MSLIEQNKRFWERRNIRIPIMCWEFSGEKPMGRGVEVVNKDLSANGISFESKSIYPIDTLLWSEIHMPGMKKPITTKLKIARIETIVGKDTYLIGASFHEIRPEDRDYIVSSLEKLNLYTTLEQALKQGASDVHLTVGRPPIIRKEGRIQTMKADTIEEGQVRAMLYPLLSNAQIENFEKNKELDFAFSPNINSRFRVNIHFQKGFLEASLRSIPAQTRTFKDLGLPVEAMERFCREKTGLVLIAGPTGSGKTTTVASMVDFINKTQERVIITTEDPIEYLHVSQKGVIKQRELGIDTLSYAEALKRSLRQDPDVVVVGELLDRDCVTAAIRAAETGHLIISTVHAPDVMQAVERIVNFFPPEHAASISHQIATCLIGILFQSLLPGRNGSRVLATELLIANNAVRNIIREGKFIQIPLSIQTGRDYGMYTLENRLKELYELGLIDFGIMQEFMRKQSAQRL